MVRTDRPPSGQQPRRVLVLQTAFLGDLILTLPLIQATAEAFPEAHIGTLTIPTTAAILLNHPAVHQRLIYDKRGRDKGLGGFLRMARQLRQEHFDLAMVPHRSLRSALLTATAKIPRRVGFSTSGGSFLFTHKVPRPGECHEVERNLSLLRALGATAPSQPPRIYPADEDHQRARDFLARHHIDPQQDLVGVAPGSVWATKRWLAEGFAEVIGDLQRTRGLTAVLLGGDEDRALCQQIAARSESEVPVAAGELPVLASAALMKRCRLVLSNDSAAAHLAAAVDRPVVAIFGPTVPRFGFAPYGDQHVIVQAPLACRPCGVHGGRHCPRGTLACMRDIAPQSVLEAIEVILKREVGPV